MKKDGGKSIQLFLAHASFMLSGFMIFNPIFGSDNIILALITSFLTSFICLEISLQCFSGKSNVVYSHSFTAKLLSCIAAILTVITSLLLITEVIKDTAYIANRGVSTFYYIALSLCLLAVAFSLCIGSGKGIFRFCVLSSLPLSLMLITGFTAPITTRSLINPFMLPQRITGVLKAGAISGIFTGFDTALFLLAFGKYKALGPKNKDSLILRLSLSFSYLLIFAFCILTAAVFGHKLISQLDDSTFALIKLIPGIDFTEFISASRIIAFIIKANVYTEGISRILSNAFSDGSDKSTKKAKAVVFSAIPLIYLFFMFFRGTLSYGAFQHLIYPATAMLSAVILIYTVIFKKKQGKS